MYCFIIYIILQLVIENLLSSGENMAKKSFYKIEMLFLKILEKEESEKIKKKENNFAVKAFTFFHKVL